MPDTLSDDGLIRSLPLIRRRCRHNETEDARFADFVKSRLPLSNRDLDALVHETTASVAARIDCTACGNCCRTLQIVVDDRDIARLSKRLGATAKAFARQYVQTAPDGVKHFAASPCSFLGDDNRCTVYDDRPQACRDFPYLDTTNFRGRALVTLENVPTCPIVFNVWQTVKARLSPRKR